MAAIHERKTSTYASTSDAVWATDSDGPPHQPKSQMPRFARKTRWACGCRELEPGRSCSQLVLVNEASEQVASADLAKVDSGPVPRWYRAGGWALIERAVRPMGVVVLD